MSRLRDFDNVATPPVWALATLLLVSLLAPLGCGERSGEGRFEVDGIQKFGDCLQRTFPLEPTFMATQERIDSVGIFLQTKARIGPAGDVVYFEVFDNEEIADNPGKTITFEYPPESSPAVRAKLAPWESCPDTNASLAIEGTVRFDQFGTDSDDRMIGELVEGKIVDARTGEVVAESVTGTWDFDVEVSAPNRTWPNGRDEYQSDP